MMTVRSSFISERKGKGRLAYKWANTPALRFALVTRSSFLGIIVNPVSPEKGAPPL